MLRNFLGLVACALIIGAILVSSDLARFDNYKVEITNDKVTTTQEVKIEFNNWNFAPLITFNDWSETVIFNDSGKRFDVSDQTVCITSDTIFDVSNGKTITRMQKGQKTCFNKYGLIDQTGGQP